MIDISVVIPIFRSEKYIGKCIESLLGQSYQNFELILVDDGTDDNSINVAYNLLTKENFLNYKIIRQMNRGQASARNTGLRNALGEFIIFVDSDDIVHRDFLKILKNNLKDYCDMSICAFRFINKQTPESLTISKCSMVELKKKEFLSLFLHRNKPFLVVSILFRKSFLLSNNLCFDENVRFSEDQMFIWKCIFASDISIYTSDELYGYFLRPNSIMTASKFNEVSRSSKMYREFCDELIRDNLEYSKICNYIYPRWCLGVLFSATKIMTWQDFKKLYCQLEGRKLFFELIKLKDKKVFCLSLLISFSMRLSYYICGRI